MNEDEWEEILQRFNEEGLNTNLSDERKLLYVWRWLVDAETNCISLRHQLDKLSKRQAEELKDIRSCMEQMCGSWEMKVSTLEEQNRRFQEQLDLGSGNQSTENLVAKQIRQMLMQEGLHSIANFGITEQFGYLLDEYSRLKRHLEQEIERRRKCEQLARVVSNLPDCLKLSSPQIQRMLDRQKDEYEEEIRHQQEAMKQVKEQLKLVHEDEISRLTKENEHLSSEMAKASEKIQELVMHIGSNQGKDMSDIPWAMHILDGSYAKEMRDVKAERDQLRTKLQESQKQIREQTERVRLAERESKQIELDNDTLAFKLSEALTQIDELEEQLRREALRGKRESIFKQFASKDSVNLKNNINKYLDNRPNYQDPLEQVKELQSESTKLQEQLQCVEKQLEVMTMKYQQHKERHRDKMFRLRDMQDREQQEWKDRYEQCQKELTLVRSMLSREQEWRLKIEANCHKLQNDKDRLHNGKMDKEKLLERSFEVPFLQELGLIKSSTNRPSQQQHHQQLNGSPARSSSSIWPILSKPKKW